MDLSARLRLIDQNLISKLPEEGHDGSELNEAEEVDWVELPGDDVAIETRRRAARPTSAADSDATDNRRPS
jgi:hypothetical protein